MPYSLPEEQDINDDLNYSCHLGRLVPKVDQLGLRLVSFLSHLIFQNEVRISGRGFCGRRAQGWHVT
jgi:hypothetical protein